MGKLITTHEVEQILFSKTFSDLSASLGYSRRLEKTWQLVERDYSDPDLSLEKTAKEIGVNKNHLNVLLRQTTTFTFHRLLVRYRMLKAINMMRTKNYSLLEVALQNGFGSLTSFERNFRIILGTTPKDFRKNWIFGE